MSDLKQTVGFLQNVPLFRLEQPPPRAPGKRMVERQYAAGQPIVTQGQAVRDFYRCIRQSRGLPRTF